MRSISKLFLCSLLAASLVACGDDDGDGNGNGNGGVADAAVEADAAPEDDAAADDDAAVDEDAGMDVTCAAALEPVTTLSTYPASYSGDSTGAGADLEIAEGVCVDERSYFAEAGQDEVVALTGLVPGQTYGVTLSSADDLAFYVVTSCEALAPAEGECLLFADAAFDAGVAESGEFVAPADGTVYVVVDHWSTTPPADATYTLDVVEVECSTSIECTDPALAFCDLNTFTCTAGPDQCVGDDVYEPNDGPAAATDVTPAVGTTTSTSANICSVPVTENDFFSVDVADGDDLTVTVTWADATADLDLYVFDAAGTTYGLSYYLPTEVVTLTNLPAGTYYIEVVQFEGATPDALAYTLDVARAAGGCATSADCAAEYETQVFRGSCDVATTACNFIDGAAALAQGEACDSADDCTDGACSYSVFQSGADASVCTLACTTDADCTGALGADYACTTPYVTNFCKPVCATDTECGANVGSGAIDTGLPWDYLTCNVAAGGACDI